MSRYLLATCSEDGSIKLWGCICALTGDGVTLNSSSGDDDSTSSLTPLDLGFLEKFSKRRVRCVVVEIFFQLCIFIKSVIFDLYFIILNNDGKKEFVVVNNSRSASGVKEAHQKFLFS